MRDPSTTHGIAIMHFRVARWQGVKVSLCFVYIADPFMNYLWSCNHSNKVGAEYNLQHKTTVFVY